jgi:adenosine 3'-phospho 5'-phosphosulfate transporter B2
MKSLLIASMLHACFLSYGVLKEYLVTKDDIASPVLVFSARFASVFCGASFVLMSEKRLVFGAPLRDFLAFATTNEISTWAGYEMLKYVSFPVQVMAKSCKMLPTMIMGTVMGVAEYEWQQYVQGVAALICVAIMHFAEDSRDEPGSRSASSDTMASDIFNDSERLRSACIGSVLLIVFFTADSFTSQFQSALYKRNSQLTQTRMMLAGNTVGLAISTISLGLKWNSAVASIWKTWEDPAIGARIAMLGICGAMGQFCIYYAIKVLGPLSFTWIMTARQLLSVLISLVWFGHEISVVKISCIIIVFAIMSSRQLAKVLPKGACCACRERRSRPNGESPQKKEQ